MICKKFNVSHTHSTIRKINKGFLCVFIICISLFYIFPVWADTSLLSVLEQSSYTDKQKEIIRLVFEEAEAQGIPSELILPRLEEGIAKKVPVNRLIKVLTKEIECLVQAHDLLLSVDPDLVLSETPSIWLRTGILFSKHIPAETVRAIAGACMSRWEDYRDATVLYLSLTQWGLKSSEALMIVDSVLKSAIPGPDFIGIITIFIRGRSMNISPEEIITRMKEVINDIDSIETLEEKILY